MNILYIVGNGRERIAFCRRADGQIAAVSFPPDCSDAVIAGRCRRRTGKIPHPSRSRPAASTPQGE
ncbi:MAG: hypothetical protein PHQ27_03045 [Victivallales bacterium]|nr:hypothetical protein [Victivallales bacterium]